MTKVNSLYLSKKWIALYATMLFTIAMIYPSLAKAGQLCGLGYHYSIHSGCIPNYAYGVVYSTGTPVVYGSSGVYGAYGHVNHYTNVKNYTTVHGHGYVYHNYHGAYHGGHWAGHHYHR